MGDQTRPNVHAPPPGPRSAALMKRGDDILLGLSLIGGWPPSHYLTREIVSAMERRGVVPIYEPAYNWFRPTPALDQAPELLALGCDIVEECVAEVSAKYAKGVK